MPGRNSPVPSYLELPDPSAGTGPNQHSDVSMISRRVHRRAWIGRGERIPAMPQPPSGAVGQLAQFVLTPAIGLPLLSSYESIPFRGELGRGCQRTAVGDETQRVHPQRWSLS